MARHPTEAQLVPLQHSPGYSNIGRLLIEAGKISERDVERIVQEQAEHRLRFGEAALRLGLIQEDDILRALSRQFEYPYVPVHHSPLSRELVAAYKPQSRPVEALRALRSQLILRWFGRHRKCLTLVSATPDVECGTVAANLALVFSQLGERTLLIDGDLREPALHQLFGLVNRSGLSSLLAGRNPWEQVVRPIDGFVNLRVISAGATPPNPQELLGRAAFSQLLYSASREFDVILVRASPMLACADALSVCSRTGGCVLVARRHETRLADLQWAKQQISATGAEIVGVVLMD